MVRKPNKTMIGLFLLLGSAVFVFILGVYVKRVFFPDNSNVVVMYFQESIKGLNVGSSVVFQGVEIGKVSRIDLVADMENLTFSIPVYVNLDVSKTFVAGQDGYRNRKEVLDALIKKGLRARLTAQNYLTGQLMIELAILPETPVSMEAELADKDILQIPTVLSPLGELSRGLQNIPFKDIADKFSHMADLFNTQIPIILPQITEITTNLNRLLNNNSRLSTEALANFNRTLIEVGAAARSFRDLSDYLERHPEALLRGKGE